MNDTLRLAQVEAELGRVPEAIRLARSTFDTRPEDKAPILPAIYFKIVPAAEAKSHDKELADLLEDGTVQHERVRVDPTSGGGRRFLIAKRKHLHNAHIKAAELYEATGHPAEAAASRAKAGNDPASTA